MCRNGEYTERGIKARHGYGSERWRIEPDFAVKLDPALGQLGVLLEPTSVVAKAWEQIERDRRARVARRPARAGHRRRADRPARRAARRAARARGPRARPDDGRAEAASWSRDLGATYHTGAVIEVGRAPDIVIECTGAARS